MMKKWFLSFKEANTYKKILIILTIYIVAILFTFLGHLIESLYVNLNPILQSILAIFLLLAGIVNVSIPFLHIYLIIILSKTIINKLKSRTVKAILIIILIHIHFPIILMLGNFYEKVLYCNPTAMASCGHPMYIVLSVCALLSWLLLLFSVPASVIGLISSIIYDLAKFFKK